MTCNITFTFLIKKFEIWQKKSWGDIKCSVYYVIVFLIMILKAHMKKKIHSEKQMKVKMVYIPADHFETSECQITTC